jgi:hypothetical protein
VNGLAVRSEGGGEGRHCREEKKRKESPLKIMADFAVRTSTVFKSNESNRTQILYKDIVNGWPGWLASAKDERTDRQTYSVVTK